MDFFSVTKLDIKHLEEYVASVVKSATANFITVQGATSLIYESVQYEIAKVLASLVVVPAQLTSQEVTGDASVTADVVYSNLESETDVAVVTLPVINTPKKVTLVAKRGGLKIMPNGYNLPQRNTIQGDLDLTIGVDQLASLVGSPLATTCVMKPIFYKYANVTLLSDGVDTWYVV